MSQAPRTLLSIQYLRGLAALGVVAHHTQWTHTSIGAAGVDVFFVISGFIMMHVSRREASPAAFLRARAIRVVPLYWLMTLLAAAAYGTTDTGHLLQSLLFWPHPGPEGRGWPVLVPGWTLCYEAFFYVVFAACLLTRERLLPAVTAVLAALVGLGAVLRPEPFGAVGVYTGPLLLEFLAGIWLCEAWRRGWLRLAWPILPVGVALVAVQFPLAAPITWQWLQWGLPAVLIVAGAVSLEGAGRLPALPGLRRLGDASYALYLTHPLVLDQVRPLVQPLPAVLAIPAALTACVAVGMLAHYVVERPLTRWAGAAPAQREEGAQHGALRPTGS